MSALAETPTASPAPVAHADVIEGEQLVTTGLRPMESWTMEATVSGDLRIDGTAMAVSEPDTECVRALIVRKGRVGLLGWSWRGGQALWCERLPEKRHDAPTHLAAVLSDSGNLVLFADGEPVRSWSTGGLFAGRHEQALTAAPAVVFGQERIPGWAGPVQDLAHYDHALSTPVVAGHARAALGLHEPVPPPPPAQRAPDPVGCPNPAHVPAWRRDGKRLRCLQCEPPRGCPTDEHEPYWRRAGGDMLSDPEGWWNLTCSLCETTAARLAANHNSGAPS